MTNFKPAFFSLILASVLTACTGGVSENTQRQAIPGELPDPSIIQVDDVYYATGSSNDWGPIYPIYRSKDLKHWSFVTYVFNRAPSWTISSYWAPELFYHNGRFYCYYTARRTDGISCIGVATTEDIEAGFQDQGTIIEWGDEAIDAFVYNEDGTLYITWKAYGLTQDKPIQILGSQLTDDGLALTGEHFEVVTAENDTWEAGGIEGQCIVRKNGYLYMLYSGNACCGVNCNYQVGVARARSMKGPWEKYQENPLLVGNDSWKCPGHGTAIQTGDKWYYLYHAYNTDGFPYLGRSALLSELYWGTDGWPYFGLDPAKADPSVAREAIRDDFQAETLGNWWRYDVASYRFTTQLDDGQLTLTERSRKPNNQSGTALCIDPEYPDFTISTRISEKNAALKGLIFYATSANSLGLGVRDNALMLWKVKDNQFMELNRIELENPEGIFLKAGISDAHVVDFHYSQDGQNWQPVKNNVEGADQVYGDNLAWWSWGMKAGLFVKAEADGGDDSAVFEEFSLEYR